MLGALLWFAGMGVTHKLGDKLHANPLNIALLTMVATSARIMTKDGSSGISAGTSLGPS